MASVIIDPDDVRYFANHLKSTADAIMSREREINSSYHHLTQFWKDDKYKRFDQTFSDLRIYLNNFNQAAELYAAYLHRKARAIDEYHGGGLR